MDCTLEALGLFDNDQSGHKLGLKLALTPSIIMRFQHFSSGAQEFYPFGLVWVKHHDVDLKKDQTFIRRTTNFEANRVNRICDVWEETVMIEVHGNRYVELNA